MKKLIFKTALLTLGVALIFLIAVFGVVSFAAPVAMMDFTASLGLDSISGDYAYQAYESSTGEGKISYLVRAFEIAAESGNNRLAKSRFEELFGTEESERRAEFEEYCNAQGAVQFPDGADDKLNEAFRGYSYRGYLCGQAATVYYRLAKEDEEKTAALDFAFQETPALDCDNSPLYYLAVEGVQQQDAAFCVELYVRLENQTYEHNAAYGRIESALRACKNFDELLNERSVNI